MTNPAYTALATLYDTLAGVKPATRDGSSIAVEMFIDPPSGDLYIRTPDGLYQVALLNGGAEVKDISPGWPWTTV